MNKNVKLALDLFGVLVSAVSFALLWYNERYIIATLLLAILCSLLLYFFRLIYHRPVKTLEVHYEYNLIDTAGKLAEIKKTKLIEIMDDNVTQLHDPQISASGKIKNLQSSIGNVTLNDKGGNYSATTNLDIPLQKGEKLEYTLTFQGINSFLENKESVTCTALSKWLKFSIIVIFPSARQPKKSIVTRLSDHSKEDITSKVLKQINYGYIITVDKPKNGSIYTFEWDW